MKFLLHRQHHLNHRFLFQEQPSNAEAYIEAIDNITPDGEFTEADIRAALDRLGGHLNTVSPEELQAACGGIDFTNIEGVDGLVASIETRLNAERVSLDAQLQEAWDQSTVEIERDIIPEGFLLELGDLAETEIESDPPSSEEVQRFVDEQRTELLERFTTFETMFETVYGDYESAINIPEEFMSAEDIQSQILDLAFHTIDTEDKSLEELNEEIERIRLRVQSYGRQSVETGEILPPGDTQTPTVADALYDVVEENYEPTPEIQALIDQAETLAEQAEDADDPAEAERLRAEAAAAAERARRAQEAHRRAQTSTLAGLLAQTEGELFAEDGGAPTPNLENLQSFFDGVMEARGIDPNIDPSTISNPIARAVYQQMPPGAAPEEGFQWSDPPTLADLWRWLMDFIYGEDEDAPTDEWGRPLGNAVPRGNYRPRGLENVEGHVPNITLNPEFYGEQLMEDFARLPQSYHDAADEITTGTSWGPGSLSEDLESGGDINGWRLAVMRNAVNSHRYGQDFSANKPFFANDLGTYRALIYYPGEGTVEVPCYGGSGGISNVSESHGSPLGSFHFTNATDRGSHRYGWSATVNGMEPMRESYRTDYDQGPNIDPGSGNSNSAGRAILMHGANGRTWGCWGIPRDEAIRFGQVVQQRGGGNGEAFVSTAQ